MKERVVIVTGGSKGIGKFIALNFFNQGYSVVICSRNERELQEACLDISTHGDRIKWVVADVSKPEDCEKVVRFTLEKFKHIDVLVNNAGIYGEISNFLESDPIAWTKAIEVNVFGTVFMTRSVLPIMKKQGKGKIVNFSGGGVGGKRPLPHFSSYYTSKAAVVALTETLAEELIEDNIQINCISPGAINTNFTEYLIQQGPERAGEVAYKKALEQKATGGDSIDKVFEMVSFLSSEDSAGITGRMLSVKWDTIEMLNSSEISPDMFKLRRIDNELFYTK